MAITPPPQIKIIISTGQDVKKSEALDFEGGHVKWRRCTGKQYCMLSCIRLFATLWTVALQAPLSIGFSRQEYWSELPFLPLGNLPDPGIEPVSPASPALQVDSLLLNHQGSPKNRWFLKKFNIESSCDPAISLLGIFPKELKAEPGRDTCTPVFIVILFTAVKRWKQPSVHQQINS